MHLLICLSLIIIEAAQRRCESTREEVKGGKRLLRKRKRERKVRDAGKKERRSDGVWGRCVKEERDCRETGCP